MNAAFYQILGNNLVANVTNFTVWFAITFWIFLETHSVFATGMIAGIYLIFTSAFGIWFGSLVDHNAKRLVMLGSSSGLQRSSTARQWSFCWPRRRRDDGCGQRMALGFVLVVMLGVLAGNIRGIALATIVTIMVPEEGRDKANGMVGMVGGIGFLTTSVISGFLVAWGGMFYTLMFALVLTVLVFLHLLLVQVDEKRGRARADGGREPAKAEPKRVDLAGTIRVVAGVPGLFALIFFAAFNNFLGGVFMALIDAYGLSLVSVQVWGLLFGVLTLRLHHLGTGDFEARARGEPAAYTDGGESHYVVGELRCSRCKAQSGCWLPACFIWLLLGPYAEAAEATTLQKVVPLERQGRVFGFAQSVELAASPLTAFLIGPLTQFVVIPFMTDGWGAQTIGELVTGPARRGAWRWCSRWPGSSG